MTTKETWKPVTIGGVTGILMGAGAIGGLQALASGSNEVIASVPEDSPLKTTVINDSMSFGEAFDTARAQLGPGAVFTWHGHIFNTYTKAEWDAMPHPAKEELSEQVKPEKTVDEIDTDQIATDQIAANTTLADDQTDNHTKELSQEDTSIKEETKEVADKGSAPVEEPKEEPDEDVIISNNQHEQSKDDVAIAKNQEEPIQEGNQFVQEATWDELTKEENDVRILGYKELELEDGTSFVMQGIDINGQRVAVIDVDKDGEPDIAMTDLNHNLQMDEGEVIDLHTGDAITFTNDDTAEVAGPELDPFTA